MDFTNDEWFVVQDIKGLINSSRILVFNSFGKKDTSEDATILDLHLSDKDKEELDKVLSLAESEVIVTGILKKQKHKKNKSIRYLLNDKLFMKIIESLNDRMVSNMLNNLVNKGLIETAYDAEADDFIFWVADENKNKKNLETD